MCFIFFSLIEWSVLMTCRRNPCVLARCSTSYVMVCTCVFVLSLLAYVCTAMSYSSCLRCNVSYCCRYLLVLVRFSIPSPTTSKISSRFNETMWRIQQQNTAVITLFLWLFSPWARLLLLCFFLGMTSILPRLHFSSQYTIQCVLLQQACFCFRRNCLFGNRCRLHT